jgi:hypothetical protein
MKTMALAKLLCLVALLGMASMRTARAQTQQINSQQGIGTSALQTLRPPPETAPVAEEIGVAPLLDQLGSKDTLAWLANDREMQRDRERLVKVCCAPQLPVSIQDLSPAWLSNLTLTRK